MAMPWGPTMLLESTRFRPGDLEHWRRMEQLDARWARTAAFARRINEARRAVDAFLLNGGAYVATSWGKDSVVVADLVLRDHPSTPVVHLHCPSFNPDCAEVAAAFALVHPGARILTHESPDSRSFEADIAASRRELDLPSRYISGIRAQESSERRIRAAVWGTTSPNTCAPLSAWSANDVFAYLSLYDLPVHPAYAMTLGGRLDRGRIRVDTIGECLGTGVGRAEWERTYYPHVEVNR